MKNNFHKLYFTIILIIAVLGMIATFIFALLFNNDAGINAAENATADTFFNVAYWITAVFIFISILLAIIFALFQLVKLFIDNPKRGLFTIIPIGIAIVLFVISYVLSMPNDLSQEKLISSGTSEGTSKMIGSGLIMTYIMVGLVVLVTIYTEIAKKFK